MSAGFFTMLNRALSSLRLLVLKRPFIHSRVKSPLDDASVLINILGQVVQSLRRLSNIKIFPLLDDSQIMGTASLCFLASSYSSDTFVTQIEKRTIESTADRDIIILIRSSLLVSRNQTGFLQRPMKAKSLQIFHGCYDH